MSGLDHQHFAEVLQRLKFETRAVQDQEVATLLGMKAAAFSERKKRNTFPTEKLYALAAKRPDLALDVNYIMTGIRSGSLPPANVPTHDLAVTITVTIAGGQPIGTVTGAPAALRVLQALLGAMTP